LPGAYEKSQDTVHVAIVGALQRDREIKGTAQDEEVVTSRVAFQVAGAYDIDLVQLIGIVGFGAGVYGLGQRPSELERRPAQPGPRHDTLNSAHAG
jgi:hypothetical protein